MILVRRGSEKGSTVLRLHQVLEKVLQKNFLVETVGQMEVGDGDQRTLVLSVAVLQTWVLEEKPVDEADGHGHLLLPVESVEAVFSLPLCWLHPELPDPVFFSSRFSTVR